MVAIRAKGNNILKTSNEDISASQMPILCSIFLLQIFYWYFSSGPRGALWSIYKKFRVQGLINFWRVQWFIESVLILFLFEPDIISNLLQETKTFLRYFIFNNFNYKAFFKKDSATFRQFLKCLEKFNLLYFIKCLLFNIPGPTRGGVPQARVPGSFVTTCAWTSAL